MMERREAEAVLGRLHQAQNRFHAGGGDEELREVLAPDVLWSVPGRNAIAGRYEGVAEVLAYFRRRRELAAATFRLHPREMMVGDGDHVAVLTDGTAKIAGGERRWSTVGLYRLGEGRVRECHLLPLDPDAFDRIWSAPPGSRER